MDVISQTHFLFNDKIGLSVLLMIELFTYEYIIRITPTLIIMKYGMEAYMPSEKSDERDRIIELLIPLIVMLGILSIGAGFFGCKNKNPILLLPYYVHRIFLVGGMVVLLPLCLGTLNILAIIGCSDSGAIQMMELIKIAPIMLLQIYWANVIFRGFKEMRKDSQGTQSLINEHQLTTSEPYNILSEF